MFDENDGNDWYNIEMAFAIRHRISLSPLLEKTHTHKPHQLAKWQSHPKPSSTYTIDNQQSTKKSKDQSKLSAKLTRNQVNQQVCVKQISPVSDALL